MRIRGASRQVRGWLGLLVATVVTHGGAHAESTLLPLLEEQATGPAVTAGPSPSAEATPSGITPPVTVAPAATAPSTAAAASSAEASVEAAVDAAADASADSSAGEAPQPRAETTPETELRADVGSYPLDAVSRSAPRGRLRCPTSDLVTYRGTHLRFPLPVAMHRDFVQYVVRLEQLAIEVAREVYGRAPKTMLHRGAYNCRRIRGVRDVLSEHAFGNAIDLKGFDFYGAREDEPLPEGAPTHLRRSFRITVERDFRSDDPLRAYHRRFFERLTERLAADPAWFGVMLGPSYPGHHDHLHLDRAPLRYVAF